MKFFTKKDLSYLLVIAILILSAVFFCIKGMISEKKYDNYREHILNRALEGSTQLLGEYIKTEDPHLSSFISSRLNELPLESEEREAVTLFCTDISLSANNSESKKRALIYAEELFTVLCENRAELRRGNTSSFPLYEGDAPVSSQPVDNKAPAVAKRLLETDEPRSYSRGELVGYRTASAYAEFESGTLVRYLCLRGGKTAVTAEDAKSDAEKFAKIYCGGGKIISERLEGDNFRYDYDGFYIVVSPYGGVMRYERTNF